MALKSMGSADSATPEDNAAAREAAAGFVDSESWAQLTQSSQLKGFAASWLRLQCEQLERVKTAVLVLRSDGREEEFLPVATWPAGAAPDEGMEAVAEAALAERRGVIKRSGPTADGAPGACRVAYPVVVDDAAVGVAAMTIEGLSDGVLPHVMRQLQWGTSWIEAFYRRRNLVSRDALAQVLDVVAIALEQPRFRGAATALVTELARLLDCHRVSIGMRRPGKARSHAKIAALSHSAEFSEKNNLIRRLAAAVDEAADQQATLVHPAPAAAQPHVLRAQEELAEVDGAENVCTVPLADDDQVIGGMVLERNGTFQRHEVERLEHVAALIGPILNLKRLEDRWLGAKAWASAIELRDRLFGARYPGIKLAALSLVAAGIVLTAVDGTYRVTSDASLEGIIQRSVTAPIAGYVADSSARAGDIVTKDQVLATLDEKDFQLEKVRWISEREKYRREYSRALAQGDRGAVRVLAAQIEQADAQIRLLDEQLARTRIVAPFDGIIVSGDLSQSLSAPVERGDVLFKVAPLDSYRVVLEVDERDIAAVGEGQDGLLALTGSPGEPLSFSVEKITPVATAREGRNFFRVEGRLLDAGDALRPGMEGVAKIEVEKRSLLWIYTHKLVHWWRVWLWQVLP